ncbi:hypothetical protein ON010_g2830 [Phytophthora cinnamomi]|nr:hypothetical protein ON010_g2830 [Phytophthora cinnamomi]
MLGGIFHKRKKSQELRSPSLQDLKKCVSLVMDALLGGSIYKAIAGQKDLHTVEFRQEDITDPQMIALAEALLEIPIVSSLDLRDNRITDDFYCWIKTVQGAKALLEVLRLQIIAAKTPPTIDARTKQPLYPPLPEYTRYVTNVNLKGNEVSASVLQELSQYVDVLRREDKRLEIRAALNRIDRNSDGSIDEEEFKGVLKLLTTSTPTKKEIRAFMQQHTLSTDNTQNVVNLENVLLAKCAISPSRHSACPPWEALVQERHAILGAPRMAPTMMATAPESHDPPSSKTQISRPSLTPSDSGMTTGNANPFYRSNSTPDVSPLSSPTTQAPVAPIEMVNAAPKPPVVPVVSAPIVQHQATKMPESKSATSTALSQPSPRSARSSVDDEGQRNLPTVRDAGPNSIISAPSSPHDSDISDSMSVVSSAFGGSVSQRIMEDHEALNASERKLSATLGMNPSSTNLDSPRWQSEQFSAEDEEGASSGGPGGTREDIDELSSGDVDDVIRSVYSHRGPKSLVTSGSSSNELSDNKSLSGPSRHEASCSGNNTPRELATVKGSEYSGAEHDEKRSLPGSVVSTPRFDDLSSLVYRGTEEAGRSTEKIGPPLDQPEEDEETEERVDSLVFDVMKDGKERYVLKLVHSEFRSGLPVKDFPAELPFRNLVALLLPENGLSDLTLFEELRALSVSHNVIRTVTNVEHLLQLEILQLANNQIATVHALRILSLNKVLAHLNLDGNPVVETDERQKRKNIVHVRNLIPALQSLGSIPCAGLHMKDKSKASTSANPSKSLFDSDLMPDHKTLWISAACDTLHILQDATSPGSRESQHDDDEWDTRDEDRGEYRPKRPLTREQQRQKDEMRSRAIGFRSRGKAIPSPPKVKTSVYCFGPPQPPPIKKIKKKAVPADPKLVREQQRRASELSAPKHAPVDKTLMHQEQKRKSRVDFNVAMTVGERLQLARDMTQRRPTASIGLSARSRSILAKADNRKRASTVTSMDTHEEANGPEGNCKSSSPHRASPIKDAVVFRIDPANTPRSPKGVLSFRVDPHPAGIDGQQTSPKSNGSKEASFLHDLAVSDFLNHAEEEFSTALTALNVLLSMSEKEHGDLKKLADYRASLDALDILNEHESHELFRKAQGHPKHDLQAQCTEWFTKLGVVKKCMRQLLEKLQGHAPGSGVIRAYCRCLRSNELRGIITTMLESQEEVLSQPSAAEIVEDEFEQQNEMPGGEQVFTSSSADDTPNEKPQLEHPIPSSIASRLFGETLPLVHDENNSSPHTSDDVFSGEQRPNDVFTDDANLDFLESSEATFDDNMAQDTKSAVAHSDDDISNSLNYSPVPESILLASTTDITMDIQMNSSAQHTDDSPWNDDTVEDNGDAGEATIVTESGEVNSQNDAEYPIEVYDSKDHQPTKIGEVDEAPQEASPEATTAQSEDYDWLADSTDLSAECNEGDSFEHDMSAVSEDEVEGSAGQEQANPPLDDSWPNVDTTEPTMEEEVEVLDEAFNNNGDPNENEEAYETGEMVDNTDVAAEEDTEATENQYELGGGVDADDEEAETFGDWEKGFDPNSNHYFWFNHSTGESSWTPPEGWPHEVDEPFSADNEDATEDPGAAEEQPDRGYEEGTEGQEYEEGGVEGQDYSEEATEGHYYEEGVEGQEYGAEEQYYDESAAEGQYYEEGAEGQAYEDAAAEGQYYEEGAAQDESQEYDEGAVEDHAYDEGAVEEQQYDENTAADGQWYEETDAEGQEYATEDQKYEVATDEEQVVEQAGEESPRRSEVSDFEFDDSDLPGF